MEAVFRFLFVIYLGLLGAGAQDRVLSFEGGSGLGKGKRIVLISGDEEYRSEESMPMLAKILSKHHGFETSVLFSWSEDGSYIDPNNQHGTHGWQLLENADLIIVGTRFRRVNDEAIQYMTAYLNAGKPVIGFRTSTHAFVGEGAFGQIAAGQWGLKIVGETWVSHHGGHKRQGARGFIEKGQEKHPILQDVQDVFGPSDVYGVKHLTSDDTVLLRGGVTESLDPKSALVEGPKNDPMMALAWLHPYTSPDGQGKGMAFCTTMGASVDFLSEDLRRLLINACFHLLEIEVPAKAEVSFIDPFCPSFYGFWNGANAEIWSKRKLQASDFGLGKAPVAYDPPGTPEWPFRPTK
jgi:hypothetical protein